MANINLTFNGLDNDSVNYIALSDIPNIVKIEDTGYTGAQLAELRLSCTTTTIADKDDGRFIIELFGETISSVKNYENAINDNFWVSSSSNNSTAASIARALRNCQSLSANFKIENNGNVVRITGRRLFETDFQSNFFIYDNTGEYSQSDLFNNFFNFTASDGQNPSVLTNSKVQVDVYSGESYDYVTTLEKVCPDTEVSFNVSPVITSIAEYGRTNKWAYRAAYTTTSGAYNSLNDYMDNTNYVSIGGGYEIPEGRGLNQIDASISCIAMPILNRFGPNVSFTNQYALYTYGSTIPLSFYRGNYGGGNIVITYRDSAYQVITSNTVTWQSIDSSNKLKEVDLDLAYDQQTLTLFNESFYIDIEVIGQSLRYNVIKPLKAAEDYTRIYFRNPLGGLSFFDFTGKKTLSESINDVKTYQHSIYEFQENYNENVGEVIYGKTVTKNITVRSHIVQESAKYLFRDLVKANKTYITIDNQNFDIIIDSVDFTELDSSNNLFEATVKFHYSITL